MNEILFDDTYTGPRWRYGLQYRPLTNAGVPKGWIVFSDKVHSDYPAFGTVEYPFELTDEMAKQTDIVPLGKVEEALDDLQVS